MGIYKRGVLQQSNGLSYLINTRLTKFSIGFLLGIAKGKTVSYLMSCWKAIITTENLPYIILHQRAIARLFTKRDPYTQTH
ncbi:hypothetical protein [Nostoc sp. CCY 9925]|uniref:hypothetical protein n=1 Tax=Nostoc sp. CCY 9925 TaxID=3103865 RepID=UPI0039C7211A